MLNNRFFRIAPLIAFFFLSSLQSLADVKSPIEKLEKIDFDGKHLNFTYRTGGGCQGHKAAVTLSVKTTELSETFSRAKVDVKVLDVSLEPDFCEALISVSASVDLKQMIADELKKLEKPGHVIDAEIDLTLPRVSMSRY